MSDPRDSRDDFLARIRFLDAEEYPESEEEQKYREEWMDFQSHFTDNSGEREDN